MTARFVPNRHGLGALLNSPDMRNVVRRKADRVAAVARDRAPVDTGEYRDNIRVESDTTDRAVERVVADCDHGWVVEYTTRNLGRALDAARRA